MTPNSEIRREELIKKTAFDMSDVVREWQKIHSEWVTKTGTAKYRWFDYAGMTRRAQELLAESASIVATIESLKSRDDSKLREDLSSFLDILHNASKNILGIMIALVKIAGGLYELSKPDGRRNYALNRFQDDMKAYNKFSEAYFEVGRQLNDAYPRTFPGDTDQAK